LKALIYLRLRQLRERHGPREFGKIAQKLMALAFRLGGCTHVVERGVQGVDVDAALGNQRYALEIKTTRHAAIAFLRKDADGLASREQDGYQPMLGALQLAYFSTWCIADARPLRPGTLTIDSLRPFRQSQLERILQPLFDIAVEQHHDGILRGSQGYLDCVLRQNGVTIHLPTGGRPAHY
jgi:hypothetical protein